MGCGAFMVEGLKTVPIRSPDEMRQVLEGGRRRCVYMETSRTRSRGVLQGATQELCLLEAAASSFFTKLRVN